MPPKFRLEAAKTLLDRGGHIAPKARDDSVRQEKGLNEMSTEELRALPPGRPSAPVAVARALWLSQCGNF